MTAKPNKAHTAALNRIARKYGAPPYSDSPFDLQFDDMTIEVETTATIEDALKRLQKQKGKVYIAVTNKEAIRMALKCTENSRVGVMDPHGEVVRESQEK
jgi:hypothetical protein